MVSFNFVDTVVSFIKTNQSVQILTKYPYVIKEGQEIVTDTRIGSSTALSDFGWVVSRARYSKLNTNYTNALVQAFMEITLTAPKGTYTAANFLAAAQDVELQFRENFVSSTKTQDFEMDLTIDDVAFKAVGTIRYKKWVDASA